MGRISAPSHDKVKRAKNMAHITKVPMECFMLCCETFADISAWILEDMLRNPLIGKLKNKNTYEKRLSKIGEPYSTI